MSWIFSGSESSESTWIVWHKPGRDSVVTECTHSRFFATPCDTSEQEGALCSHLRRCACNGKRNRKELGDDAMTTRLVKGGFRRGDHMPKYVRSVYVIDGGNVAVPMETEGVGEMVEH